MYNYREDFWKKRAEYYEKLQWATRSSYLGHFFDAGEFDSNDLLLDIGTGTGIIVHTISPYVDRAIGIDVSSSMLNRALSRRTYNETFMKCDARKLPFLEDTFSKVTARMVFHHIVENTQKAMEECYRVLEKGGWMIFSEGVPPTENVKPFYVEMFKLKEERLTFMEEDLEELMVSSGFRIIKKLSYWETRSSIRNWLENSGLTQEIQDKIFQMHLDLDEQGKKDYNMVISNNDCFIDMKFVILAGEK